MNIESIQSWLLIFAVILALVLAFSAFRASLKQEETSNSKEIAPTLFESPEELERSLASAEEMNSHSAIMGQEPDVRIGKILHYSPRDYQSAIGEVSMRFRENRVLSIDLKGMSPRQAARLVDFCSGMAVASRGWIYRVTDQVVILTPPD
ncbi:cell division protein SepF [Nocardiopsis nanhaiensis]